ncbi:MAG: hypothetical protein AAGI68_04910 [Planctomycetota bacterium]
MNHSSAVIDRSNARIGLPGTPVRPSLRRRVARNPGVLAKEQQVIRESLDDESRDAERSEIFYGYSGFCQSIVQKSPIFGVNLLL